MLDIWAYDVEILPNFFSITFVNLGDYYKKFKDCCKIEVKKGNITASEGNITAKK